MIYEVEAQSLLYKKIQAIINLIDGLEYSYGPIIINSRGKDTFTFSLDERVGDTSFSRSSYILSDDLLEIMTLDEIKFVLEKYFNSSCGFRSNLYDILDSSFSWESTIQGFMHWNNIQYAIGELEHRYDEI